VFLGMVHAPNVRHVRPSPTHPGLSSTILAHLWCKCVPWVVHAPVRHVRPSQLSGLSSTILAHLWCVMCGTCTECETCETIPNYPGLSQLSWPPGKCVPGRYMHQCETCETIPNYLDCSNHPGPPCMSWWYTCTECETCETIPTILDCPQLSWPTLV
jgi:hypothetical protein